MVKLVFDFGEAEIKDDPSSALGRRLSTRYLRLIRPAKLLMDGRDLLCVVRDISNGGLQLQLFHELPEHDEIAIEFDSAHRYPLREVWKSGGRMGCAFLQHVDIKPILSSEGLEHPKRQPRLQVDHDAHLFSDGKKVPVIVRDISQRGVALDCPAWLMIDELVRLESKAIPPVYAKVRWRSPPRYGLVLEQTFGMASLAKICLQM